MPIYAPPETLKALGNGLLPECKSRSLFKDRFADPQAKDPAHKQWFNALIGRKAESVTRADWLPPAAETLHTRLMSRQMVDLAGGVMENANLRLDRYGLPVIPGSAVKGCARRMALQALHDWIAAGTERPADDDACAPCCENFKTPADMLAAIARIFGWVETDWETHKKNELWKSDFAWACADTEGAVEQVRITLAAARDQLPQHDTFAGTIAFPPASPNTDPGLELDVVTPHHTNYHSGKPGFDHAPDTEDPIPVYFPAIKPQKDGDYFNFPLIPLRLAADGDLAHAKLWLAHGLELFGLGAKTHADYGWFQVLSDGHAAFPDRFESKRSPVESFLKQWGTKVVNNLSARAFSKQIVDFDSAALLEIFAAIAPGKTSDFKDPFWNPFKTDPAGKVLLEKLRTQP